MTPQHEISVNVTITIDVTVNGAPLAALRGQSVVGAVQRQDDDSGDDDDMEPIGETSKRFRPELRLFTVAELAARAADPEISPRGRGHVTREVNRRVRELRELGASLDGEGQ